jgi:protein-disulfide isomerase
MHLVAALATILALHIPAPAQILAGGHPSREVTETANDSLDDDLELIRAAAASRMLGPSADSATVTILEFFDYACSTCQNFHRERGDSLKALVGPDVALHLHSYVLPRLIRGYPAAEAALCAGGVGGRDGYAAMHDRLMRTASDWRQALDGPELFTVWAGELGLDVERFTDCIARDVPSPLVVADAQMAARYAVGGTPTFVFLPRGATDLDEAEVFYGNEPMARFRDALAAARSRAR